MEKRAKKRSYDAAFKLKVVAHAEKTSKNNASKTFQVDRRRVVEWCQQKEQLGGIGRSAKRLCGAGRKPLSRSIEDQLVEYIRNKRSDKLRVTRKMLKLEAIRLHRADGNEEFKGSEGWLYRFMQRNKISLRRKTTVSQRLPCDLVPKIASYIMTVRQKRWNYNYDLPFIGAMDETALWLDMPAATTLDFRGERSIPIKTSGHEKVTCTIPFLVLPPHFVLMYRIVSQLHWQHLQMEPNSPLLSSSRESDVTRRQTKCKVL